MTKITNNSIAPDVQLHIDKAFVIIEEYLPTLYVERVIEKIDKNKPSKGVVRNVRAKLIPRIDVINAMVEVALENKKDIEKLKRLTA